MKVHLAVKHANHNNEAGKKIINEKYWSQEKNVIQVKRQSLNQLYFLGT